MGAMMAPNFKIFLHQNSDHLHLKLSGDFDGLSARQLIRTLKSHNGDAKNIFVHTSSLSSVHPFGLDVFKKNHPVESLTHSPKLTGKYAGAPAPEGCRII